ncbi:MAG: hypothetical protein KQH53_00155 [Desulfarculaceae bacterium]|nr:hypothetical protein [Desulfarculaceae bacterium]
MSRPRVSGWRQRRGLGLVTIDGWTWGGAAALAQTISESRLNLAMALLAEAGGVVRGALALEREVCPQAAGVAELVGRELRLPEPSLCPDAAVLTAYPLGGGLHLPALALAVLAGRGITPLALGTSPAALSLAFLTADLAPAIEALGPAWGLSGPPPLEQVAVVQSAARRES